MLHGTGGEDGVLQQTLQQAGLPWVGPGIAASRLTFDKVLTRQRLIEKGIPVALGETLRSADVPLPATFPVVVKPARQGSSLGVSVVTREEDWMAALENAMALCPDVIVEEYIEGREVSVPVIYGELFPVVEIVLTDGWYDYENKYVSDAAVYRLSPEDLPAGLCSLAQEACNACDAIGILRVDFRIDACGNPYVLEVNTIPGMTEHSLVPLSVAARGWSLPQFVDWCVKSGSNHNACFDRPLG
jgi:D-alanine-D-alanine ligase